MKKYLFFMMVAFGVMNSYAEGVVLSDTYASDDDVISEEPFVAPQSPSYNSSSQQARSGVKNTLVNDSSDPLFLVPDDHFSTDSYINSYDEKLRFGQYVAYGVNKNFVLHADMLYQWDLSGNHENGFSSTEFGGTYRMSHGFNQSHIISDVLFGLKLWGSSRVRTPEYADSTYYAGLRFGRQYTGVTLAGTVKSTWVFDETRGLSYLDFIPEAYFRFMYDWRAGIGADFRKSTNTHLLKNQEWLNLKLVRQYGNTQYVGHVDYEFEDNEIQFGANLKILF